MDIKSIAKNIFTQGAMKAVELMVFGAGTFYAGNKIIMSQKNSIIKEIKHEINKGDSTTINVIHEKSYNDDFNFRLVIDRISNIEDKIYPDNKELRKENQRLQNEKFRLENENKGLKIKSDQNDEKKNYNSSELCPQELIQSQGEFTSSK